MATEITMPQLSDTMHSGKILNWNKKEGDAVERGDILAEVETDKANLEIESFHSGVLLKIITGENETADVGNTIAYIGQPGEAIPESAPSSNGTGDSSAQIAATEPTPVAPQPTAPAASTPSEDAPVPATPVGAAAPLSAVQSGRVKASPLAKKIAAQKNIDLSTVQGSGPDGRIVKRDLEGLQPTPAGPSTSAAAQPTVRSESTSQSAVVAPVRASQDVTTPMSKVRETIARRMQQSVREAPHFYVTTSINMKESVRLRALLKEKPEYSGISLNHLIIKAAGYAIKHEPRVNYAVREETSVLQPAQINVGIITALEEGLLIPVVREVDRLSLQDVVFEARAAVERARAGRPSSTDLVGGTFSISNMGMFDVENFTAIINPGQGSVLAVSSIKDEPIVIDGHVVAGKIMKATISVDHRIIDGVMAGNFLKYFKEALETPALLIV